MPQVSTGSASSKIRSSMAAGMWWRERTMSDTKRSAEATVFGSRNRAFTKGRLASGSGPPELANRIRPAVTDDGFA